MSISLPVVESSLLALAKTGERKDVMALVKALHAADRFDPLVPVDDHGNAFVPAWFVAQDNRFHTPSVAMLTSFDAWTESQIWSLRNKKGETPLDVWLYRRDANDGPADMSNQDDEVLAYLIRQTPLDVLKTWSSRTLLRGSNNTGIDPSLLSYVVRQDAQQSTVALCERGWSLATTTEGPALAKFIRSKPLWDLFLQQGGDPKQPVGTDAETGRPLALWEHVRNTSKYHHVSLPLKELYETVMGWSEVHAQDALADVQMQEYWTMFLWGGNRNNLTKRMKQQKEWPTLQNAIGQTPLMLLCQNSPSEVKPLLELKKTLEGASTVDHQGRSLWYYMLNMEKLSDASAVQSWLANHVPLTLNHQGQGVVWQSIVGQGKNGEIPTSLGLHTLPQTWSPSVWKATATTPEFWWGTLDQQEVLAQWLLNVQPAGTRKKMGSLGPDDNPFCKKMVTIAANTNVEGLHPNLLGALVACDLFCFNMDADKLARMNRLVNAGAVITIDPEREPLLTDRHMTRFPDGHDELRSSLVPVFARLEQNALTLMSQGLSTLSASSDRPRL